ncbi:MAG: ABC transporter permease [Opitutae bacterium]|nr:ABC transporter permease [Opitutae bacterium]
MYSHLGSAASRASGHADLHRPDNFSLMLTGRLQPGLSLAAARLRLPALAGQLPRGPGADAQNARELSIAPPSRFSNSAEPSDNTEVAVLVTPLLFMAGSVLLIACLNLANMLLARGAARSKEIALRLALGATRGRIIQQLLVEGLVLALLGGALGLVLSVWANRAMLASLDGAIRSSSNATLSLRPELDATVLGLTFLACAAATLLFSLAPALRASRLDVVADLKAAGAAPAAGDRWNRFFAGRHLLVMGQITLSVVLLFSAGLFLRGALKAGTIPLGFASHDSLVTVIDHTLRNSSPAETQQSLAAVRARISALPGVSHAAISTQAPMSNTENSRRVLPASAPLPAPGAAAPAERGTRALFAGLSPGYFAALSVPLLRGRDFTENEARDERAPRVAIIDATLARQLFPEGDALGQRIRYAGDAAGKDAASMEIVGIVGEHRHEFLQVEPTHRIFVPLVQAPRSTTYLHTRLADGRRASVVGALAAVRR